MSSFLNPATSGVGGSNRVPIYDKAGIVSHSGTTTLDTVLTIPLPILGKNDSVEFDGLITFDGTVDTKKVTIVVGSSNVFVKSAMGATTKSIQFKAWFSNDNAQNLQRMHNVNFATGYGNTSSAYNTASEDTTVSLNAMIEIQLADATFADSARLARLNVTHIRARY